MLSLYVEPLLFVGFFFVIVGFMAFVAYQLLKGVKI